MKKKKSEIRKALEFMIDAHSGVYRKFSGVEYAHHPVSVAKIVRGKKKSKHIDKLIIASLIHDVVEDTDYTLDTIKALFGELVASIVDELTSDKKEIDKVGKKQYLSNKMLSMTSYALVIKLADRLHNCSDLESGTEKFRKNYVEQTRFILDNLIEKRYLSGTHKEIIKDVEEKIAPYEK